MPIKPYSYCGQKTLVDGHFCSDVNGCGLRTSGEDRDCFYHRIKTSAKVKPPLALRYISLQWVRIWHIVLPTLYHSLPFRRDRTHPCKCKTHIW